MPVRLVGVSTLPVVVWYCGTDRFSGVSSVTVTGRITYALARDGAFPGSHFFARVNGKLRTPVNSIMLVFIFDACLLLLQLGDNAAVAFNNIVGKPQAEPVLRDGGMSKRRPIQGDGRRLAGPESESESYHEDCQWCIPSQVGVY